MAHDLRLPELLRYLRRQQPRMLRTLERLVRQESPSTSKAAVDRLAGLVGGEWRRRGARVRLLPQRRSGALVRAEIQLGRGRPRGQLLLLGHLDTVYPLGTLTGMPFRMRGGRAFGPGIFDMKGGLVQALFAVDALRHLGFAPRHKLVCLWTSDEEIGSEISRPYFEREARRSRAVLVLEPAAGPRGALKTARKGVGEFELEVEGRAAHAGLDPESGINAIEELARQIVNLRRFARRGVGLNVDGIEGGTRTNVVAAHARAQVDVRITRRADGPWIERRLRSLKPIDPRAHLHVRGGVNRPPLERTPAVTRLFRQTQALGRELGLRLQECAVGGGSDGNFTAALGVPTLDGLGAVGGGAHSPDEFVVVRSLPERAALLAALLLTL